MFTGLVEAVGTIESTEARGGDRRLVFRTPPGFLAGAAEGDSICCSGVCLTATALAAETFAADLSVETLAATTAGAWRAGTRINFERSLTLSRPLGGHLVAGHVDGVAVLAARSEDARSRRLHFTLPAGLARYVARKGSVTIDGVSLTVNEVDAPGAELPGFGVNIIPHTLTCTTLGDLDVGAAVNIEVDLLARYVERLLAGGAAPHQGGTPA